MTGYPPFPRLWYTVKLFTVMVACGAFAIATLAVSIFGWIELLLLLVRGGF